MGAARMARARGRRAHDVRPALGGEIDPTAIGIEHGRDHRHTTEISRPRRGVLSAYDSYAAQKRPRASAQNPGQEEGPVSRTFERALCRTRTGDPFLTMEVLYQLS